MREGIGLYRGKATKNNGYYKAGDWVYGSLQVFKGYAIFDDGCWKNWVDVTPNTIGEYTGGKDTNGVRIFEGDIVRIHNTLIKPDKPFHKFEGVVDFKDSSFCIVREEITHYRWMDYEIEVIGNIHEKERGARSERWAKML